MISINNKISSTNTIAASKNSKARGGKATPINAPAAAAPSHCSSEHSGGSSVDDGSETSWASALASPQAEMEQLDINEVPWDESESFMLKKYPSYEIDWDSLLSSQLV